VFVEIPIFAQYGPSIAALVLVGAEGGWPAIRQLLRRVIQWRVGIQWYAVALLLTPLIVLTVLGVNAIFGHAPNLANLSGWYARWSRDLRTYTPSMGLMSWMAEFTAKGKWQTLLMFVTLSICNGGVSEELGWRGYLLQKLQARRSALAASIVVGLLWSFWHTDLDFWRALFTTGVTAFSKPLVYTVHTTALAILFTWVYNNSEESLLLPILFHASYNSTIIVVNLAWGAPGRFSPLVVETIIGLCVAAIIVVAIFGPDRFAFERDSGTAPSLASEPLAR
jgi:membrane protease YdiL (CAAX protease family)